MLSAGRRGFSAQVLTQCARNLRDFIPVYGMRKMVLHVQDKQFKEISRSYLCEFRRHVSLRAVYHHVLHRNASVLKNLWTKIWNWDDNAEAKRVTSHQQGSRREATMLKWSEINACQQTKLHPEIKHRVYYLSGWSSHVAKDSKSGIPKDCAVEIFPQPRQPSTWCHTNKHSKQKVTSFCMNFAISDFLHKGCFKERKVTVYIWNIRTGCVRNL